jgi:hypothetical protein
MAADDLLFPHTIKIGVLETSGQRYSDGEFLVHGRRKEEIHSIKAQVEWDETSNLQDSKGGTRSNVAGYFVVRVRDMRRLGYVSGRQILAALSRARLISVEGPGGNEDVIELDDLQIFVYFVRSFGAMESGSGFIECKFMDRSPTESPGVI